MGTMDIPDNDEKKLEEYGVPQWMRRGWDMNEAVVNESGESVPCPECGMDIYLDGIPMIWHEGNAECPECGFRMSRQMFMKEAGMEPPSEECISCKEIYPQCKARCDKIPEQYGDEFWEQRFDWY